MAEATGIKSEEFELTYMGMVEREYRAAGGGGKGNQMIY